MIYFAPLQGFTEYVYRKAYAECFLGVDKFFIPYISVKNNSILKKHLSEILPENNPQKSIVIPQVLCRDSQELLLMVKVLADYGYREINLNLGCPYPMVTHRGKGAGMLPYPERLQQLLAEYFEKTSMKLSIKMRAGLHSPAEMDHLLPVLNHFPLTEVILHPRVASQLYEGEVLEQSFEKASDLCRHRLIYNGDIFTLKDFEKKKIKFPKVENWMLGRGILMNPFLPDEMTGASLSYKSRQIKRAEFHGAVFEGYLEKMDNPGNTLNKMKQFWIYFSHQFPEQRKVLKRIKKAGTILNYTGEVEKLFKM